MSSQVKQNAADPYRSKGLPAANSPIIPTKARVPRRESNPVESRARDSLRNAQSSCAYFWLEICCQNNVRVRSSTRQSELLAVVRPGKAEDTLILKMCHLLRGTPSISLRQNCKRPRWHDKIRCLSIRRPTLLAGRRWSTKTFYWWTPSDGKTATLFLNLPSLARAGNSLPYGEKTGTGTKALTFHGSGVST